MEEKIFGMKQEEIRRMFEEMFFPKLEYRSIKKDYDISKNVAPLICTKCEGACCKMCGCHFSPDDFKEISFQYLKEKIEKGYIAIEDIDGEMICSDINVYILRVRNQKEPIAVETVRRRGPCILLTEYGCKLNYENRPSGGKLLIPSNDGTSCRSKYSIRDCCYEWKPHKKLLYELYQYFKDKEIQCLL